MIIRNGNVVLKNSVEKKDLLIENGKIVQIADCIPANGTQEIDAAGKHVFPGLIDMHVHLREPGFERKEDIESGAKAAVIDAALLFDSPLVAICDKNISVVADEKIRLERIMKRDSISENDALLRINAQPPTEYYIEKADIIINNNGDDNLNEQIGKILLAVK